MKHSHSHTIEVTSKATWDKVVAITQTSVFLGQKAASSTLKKSGRGAVVNVSSILGATDRDTLRNLTPMGRLARPE